MKTIKFSRCPIGKHKGERWPKLERVDVSQPVKLVAVIAASDNEISNDFMRNDTFQDWTWQDWEELMCTFYGFPNPCLIKLRFKQGDYIFTTARAYEWRKHKYYLNSVGKEFMVVET